MESEIVCCDCLDYIKKLPSSSVDLILSSPPYNQGRGVVGGFATGGYDKYDDQSPEKEYRKEMMLRFNAMVRVLKPTGSMFIVIGQRAIDRVMEWPFWITKVKGMKLNGVIIRKFKNSPQVRPVRYYYRHEPIFWLYKSWPPYFNPDCAEYGDVWEIDPEPDKRHPAVMPSALARMIIKSCSKPNGVVFDPFNGIGTTCLMAKDMVRQYIGCDISDKYCRIARHRVENLRTQTTFDMFSKPPRNEMLTSRVKV